MHGTAMHDSAMHDSAMHDSMHDSDLQCITHHHHHHHHQAPKAATGAQGSHRRQKAATTHHHQAPKAATGAKRQPPPTHRRPRQPPGAQGSHRRQKAATALLRVEFVRCILLRVEAGFCEAPLFHPRRHRVCVPAQVVQVGYVQAALKSQGEPRRDEGPELVELALVVLDVHVHVVEAVTPGPRHGVQRVELPH